MGYSARAEQVQPERVLVTGATGFLGSALCPYLEQRGHYVRELSRSTPDANPARERVVLGDAQSQHTYARAVAGVSAVVHLMGIAHEAEDAESETRFRLINVDATKLLLTAAIDAGVRRFVFASSVKAAAGRTLNPLKETQVARPVDTYGSSKLAAEQIIQDTVAGSRMRAVILRLPLVYGPGVKANMLRLFDAVARQRLLPLGAIRNRRSLLYVGNFVHAVDVALEAPIDGCATFYVSDDEDLSTPELVRRVAAALGERPRLVPISPAALIAAARVWDAVAGGRGRPKTPQIERLVSSLQVDCTPLRNLGYHPPFSVTEGLRHTAEWYRRRSDRAPWHS